MHTLVLPSYYPTAHQPTLGVFFREQVLALRDSGVDLGVVYAEGRSLRTARPSDLGQSHFQVLWDDDGRVPTLRRKGWNTLAQTLPGAAAWVRQMEGLSLRYVRERGLPDVIHAHNALWGGVAAARVAAAIGRPYVVTEHSSAFLTGSLTNRERFAAEATYLGAAKVLSVSRSLARAMERLTTVRSTIVVPNTVDTAFFSLPRAARQREPLVVLSIGNLTPNKGFDSLLAAFATLRVGRSQAVLEIGGEGPEQHRLESMARRLGVGSRVRFLGQLSRVEVRDAMWRANAFVLASRLETFGVVLIEALATGLPVISTGCGGPEDIIVPEVGVLLAPGDEQGLADAMVAVGSSERFKPEVLRAYAAQRFGYETVGRSLREIFEQAASVR